MNDMADNKGRLRTGVLLIGVLLIPTWAAADTMSEGMSTGTVPSAMPFPADTMAAQWGPIWYVRGRTVYDDVTMVAGGADGSAILLIQFDNDGRPQPGNAPRSDTSLWILIEGNYLYLHPMPGCPPCFITDQPGWGTTSRRYGAFTGTPVEVDKYKISQHLKGVYLHTRLSSRPVLHVPFLIGSGWHEYVARRGEDTTTRRAADIPQARQLLLDMDLHVEVAGGDTAADFVVAQEPAPGTRLAPGATVRLTTERGKRLPVTTPSGDTADAAILISASANGGVQTANITSAYSNSLTGTSCATDRRDVFWQLPIEIRGREVLVSQTLGSNADLVLSVWNRAELDGAPDPSAQLQPVGCAGEPDCCVIWPGPDLSFQGSASGVDYIMVEGRFGDTAPIEFRVEWPETKRPGPGPSILDRRPARPPGPPIE